MSRYNELEISNHLDAIIYDKNLSNDEKILKIEVELIYPLYDIIDKLDIS